MKKRLVVGLSGASGAILCVSLLEAMRKEKDWEVHLVASEAGERVLRAPCDGIFTAVHRIGDTVEEGETIGFVEGQPMKCTISGVLRGVLDDGVPVKKGMKSGDVDPRCKPEYCTTISDKALAVGGGVVEALLYLSAKAQGRR